MDKMDELYAKLTGVDIGEQKRLWDERGKGYYGEFLVFCELYKKIPGTCKILMNLEFPASFSRTTEIDLLMVHETGLYVFEVKHFKGTIYGKTSDNQWTQYFRTVSNQTFDNPIKQNQYHVDNVKRMYPDIPVYSFIVFTGDECDLRIEGSVANTSLCYFYNLIHRFNNICNDRPAVLSLPEIDGLFNEMKAFSPMVNETVCVNEKNIPFYEYVETLTENFKSSLQRYETVYLDKTKENVLACLNKCKEQERACLKKTAKTKWSAVAVCFIFAVILFFSSISIVGWYLKQADDKIIAAEEAAATAAQEATKAKEELNAFAQKFEYVKEFNDGDVVVKKDMVLVSDVLLEQSSDFDNVVNFSCLLTWNGDNYSVSIGKDVKIIVFLNDGSIKEYDLWNETYPFSYTYQLGYSNFYLTGKIGLHEFYDMSVSDIAYIKLANLGLRRKDTYAKEDCLSGYEIELYSR